MHRQYFQQKQYQIVEKVKASGECWSLFSDWRTSLAEYIGGRLFGYIQCSIEVPDYFSNLPMIFINVVSKRTEIDNLIKKHAENQSILLQPWGLHISNFHLTKGNLITPLLFFTSNWPLCAKKFIESSNTFPEMSYQFCTMCRDCTTEKGRKPNFRCCCRNNEVVSQQF